MDLYNLKVLVIHVISNDDPFYRTVTIDYVGSICTVYIRIPRKYPLDTRRHHGTDGTGRTLWTTCTYILLSIYYTCICTVYGSLGSVHGIPDDTMVLMGRDGHYGLQT